jgi:hypothetical protein
MARGSKAHFRFGGTGMGSVTVDGHDLSNLVTDLRFERDNRGDTSLVLSLVLGEIAAEVEPGHLRVDGKTRAALLVLGWTPPKGGDG